jgi:hypothetical protein
MRRDRDRSGEADETPQAAQPKARARAEGIAQPQPTNPKTPNTHIGRIVEGLTEKRRWFVTSIVYDGWWRTDEETPRGIVGPLTNAGILERERGVIGNMYRITELGKSVRTYLESMEGGNG